MGKTNYERGMSVEDLKSLYEGSLFNARKLAGDLFREIEKLQNGYRATMREICQLESLIAEIEAKASNVTLERIVQSNGDK